MININLFGRLVVNEEEGSKGYSSYKDIIEFAKTHFPKHAENCRIKYLDEENEWITISSESEYSDMRKYTKKLKMVYIRVTSEHFEKKQQKYFLKMGYCPWEKLVQKKIKETKKKCSICCSNKYCTCDPFGQLCNNFERLNENPFVQLQQQYCGDGKSNSSKKCNSFGDIVKEVFSVLCPDGKKCDDKVDDEGCMIKMDLIKYGFEKEDFIKLLKYVGGSKEKGKKLFKFMYSLRYDIKESEIGGKNDSNCKEKDK